jgi:hypothetical protein
MSYLFNIIDRHVEPTVEVLLISPFKDIWERDKTRDKSVAIQELTYIEFVASVKKTNPYRDYSQDIIESKVKEGVIKIENWEADNLILKGIEYLKNIQKEGSLSYSYYLSAKKAAEKMRDFFDTFDINEKNFKTGNPVYKPSDITRALMDTSKVLENLTALSKKVDDELFEEVKLKANKKVSVFSDPNFKL